MARSWTELKKLLEDKTGLPVYFNPPTGFRITEYPCIIFDMSVSEVSHADNCAYISHMKYSVKLIARGADEEHVNILLDIPYSKLFDTRQTAGIITYYFYIYF